MSLDRDPFLLTISHQPSGFTELQYDAGPASRIQLVTLTETAHLVREIPGGQLFAHLMTDAPKPNGRTDTS